MNPEAPKTVMIVGGGGREDAFAWKLRQSPHVGHIYIAPGNGGTQRLSDTSRIHLNPARPQEVLQAALDNYVDLVVVGPEVPLIAGVAGEARENGIATFGPNAWGAHLEGSKADATLFMKHHNIPHPESRIFENVRDVVTFLKNPDWNVISPGYVVKADGPAGGKGVFVCKTKQEAVAAVAGIMVEKEFGDAGNRIVIQEKLAGWEVSAMAVVSGRRYVMLPYSEDHKQIFDRDEGPNTGGMGVAVPHPLMTAELAREIEETIIRPTVLGMAQDGIDFRGIIYPGIMVTADGPKVLEYNTRGGDPEMEAIVPHLDGDIFPVINGAARGELLFDGAFPTKNGACVVVTMAAAGYPGSPEKGMEIYGLDTITGRENVTVFHAGTTEENGVYIVNGGRVLMVAGQGDTLPDARDAAYRAIGPGGVHFAGMQIRNDIGARAR